MYKQPNINNIQAKPYITWHLNWQTRIQKETMAAMPPQMAEDAMQHPAKLLRHRSESPAGMAAVEYPHRHPIGSAHGRNNTSSSLARVLGPSSWAGSGGLRTTMRTGFGCTSDSGGRGAEMLHSTLRQSATGAAQQRHRRSTSVPQLPQQGEQSIAAHVLRAAPYRSQASMLRDPLAGIPPEGAGFAVAKPALVADLKSNAERRDRAASDDGPAAMVARALRNRSEHTLIRHGAEALKG